MEPKSRLIYLRDCPVEVPDSAVSGFFSSYGEIHSIAHSEHQGLPGLRDGTRSRQDDADQGHSRFCACGGFRLSCVVPASAPVLRNL